VEKKVALGISKTEDLFLEKTYMEKERQSLQKIKLVSLTCS
jgi:hypothetical protein